VKNGESKILTISASLNSKEVSETNDKVNELKFSNKTYANMIK
jgi:hypothetical protein